jgi:hypothetical protein
MKAHKEHAGKSPVALAEGEWSPSHSRHFKPWPVPDVILVMLLPGSEPWLPSLQPITLPQSSCGLPQGSFHIRLGATQMSIKIISYDHEEENISVSFQHMSA